MLRILLVAVFATALTGCIGSTKLNTLVDDEAKIHTYKTYQWAGPALNDTTVFSAIDGEVRQNVDISMANKGYQLVSSGADMIIDYRVHSQAAITDTAGMTPHDYLEGALGDNARLAEMARSTYTSPNHGQLNKGNLVIFIADGKSNKITWLTSGSKMLKKIDAPRDELLKNVRTITNKAMGELPKAQ